MHSTGYDLHTHSTHSDGTTSVAELVAEVAAAGLAGFALTDHDTIAGWDEARQAAAQYQVDFFPGIELTTEHGKHAVHLLGYGVDPAHEKLQNTLRQLRAARENRVRQMVQLLAADYPVSWQQLQQRVQGAVGRPHIADELVTLGAVPDRAAAFATLLSHRSKYYVPGEYLQTLAAVQLVREAGGAPVLAHPAAQRNRSTVTRERLQELIKRGLLGIELRHPENSPQLAAAAAAAAAGLGLLVTGASDSHGAGKPNRIGDEVTSAQTVAQLREFVAVPH